MFDITQCQKVEISKGAFYYLGPSTKEESVGYLELEPCTSLTLHNRLGGFENLTQVKGSCVMIVFDKPEGTNHKLDEGDELRIEPEGVWHIHTNPFDKPSLTYWHFEGDIRKVIEEIRKRAS
jgi:predicted dehydrogenase